MPSASFSAARHEEQKPLRLHKLVLDKYNWQHLIDETFALWDWSELTHLELRFTALDQFLVSVSPKSFPPAEDLHHGRKLWQG